MQSLVCCYLHEAFIADPNLAKLVHFQVSANVSFYSLLRNPYLWGDWL